ncbi:MAG: NAD(P)-dependent oxidoreductase [Spirochaeta sp.]|jgi:phosphoglycerate dehydrogenase-like enzyme|nr:NAD(P)-dependent oxidoreductase [Spirochaeta sp.]
MKPITLLDPSPREVKLMFQPGVLEQLQEMVELRPGPEMHTYQHPTPEEVDAILPETTYVIGQTDLPRERLETAPRLKAIINVEGNFFPNIDYEYCFSHHIHVLSVSPVFARAVAELGLGLALSLARQIPQADAAFKRGRERYGLDGNQNADLLSARSIGIVGFGDLGKALLKLLHPFGREIQVFDPWVPARAIQAAGAVPVTLEELLTTSTAIFVVAAVTSDNQGFLDRAALEMIQQDALFVLLSRAGVVDFEALADTAISGALRVATDVWPEEPFDPKHAIRRAESAVLSAHRAGALYSCFYEMGERIVEDIALMNNGLPPSSCKRAEYETVTRMRSRPVQRS